MTVTSITGGGDFRIGDVLSRAWRIWIGNPAFFLGVPVLLYLAIFIPAVLVGIFFFAVGLAGNPATVTGLMILLLIVMIAFNLVGQGILLFGAFQRLRGQPPRIGEALQKVLARFVPLVGLGILWGLAIVLATGAGFAVFSGLAAVLGGWIFILSPALFVPACMLLVMWALVVPACLVEGLGPIASMKRSADLSKGFRWKIFGILVLLGLLIMAGNVVQLIVGFASQALATVIGLVWFLVWTAYWNCSIIMMYHDLRVAKEGVDTEQIASIFD